MTRLLANTVLWLLCVALGVVVIAAACHSLSLAARAF